MKSLSLSNNIKMMQIVTLVSLPLGAAYLVQLLGMTGVMPWAAGAVGLAGAIFMFYSSSRKLSPIEKACKYAESLASDMVNYSANRKKDEGTRIYKALRALADSDLTSGATSTTTDSDMEMLKAKSSMLNVLRMNVMIADENDNLVYVNDASYKAFHELAEDIRKVYGNFDPDKAIGASIHNFHKDPELIKKVLRNLKEGEIHKAKIKVGDLTFTLNVSPLFVDGTRVGAFAEWANITEQLKVEEQASKVQSCIQGLNSNVMMADEHDNLVFANDASISAFRELADDIRVVYPGFDPEKVIGASIHNFHKDPDAIRRVLHALKEGQVHRAKIKVGKLTLSLNVGGVFSNGRRMGTFAEWADVTEQMKAEEQASKVQSCIQGLNSNVMMADENDNLVFANDASQAAFVKLADDIRKVYPGFQPEKVIGASIHNFHKDPDAIRRVLHALKEGDVHRADISVGELTLSLNVGGVFSNGKRMGTFAEWADVTAQRAADAEKERVENQVEQSAKAINNATRDIAQGNTNLSERTEAQAASIEETTASMQQITERVNTNAMNSKEALTSANDTRSAADRGGDVVRNAIQAMSEISESSSKINDIIGVIDEIAFQTNLLALNAAVEAARAGEQGRGFAVVASEVRTLAGRSSKAAKEIKSLITESVQKVKVGTEQVNQTGSCLNDIIGNVTKVTDMVGDISDASQEQALSIQEINKTIAQMDTFTQQNAALVEEGSAASKALEDQAIGLIDLISATENDSIQTPDLSDFETETESDDGVEIREY